MRNVKFALSKHVIPALILIVMSFSLICEAQTSQQYPADEASFMAEANTARLAGNDKKYNQMLVEGSKRGYTEAEVNLAALFMMAPPGQIRFDLVNELLTRAASKGHGGAMYLLAFNYKNGYGMSADMEMYRYWIKKAAKTGRQEAIDACKRDKIQCE